MVLCLNLASQIYSLRSSKHLASENKQTDGRRVQKRGVHKPSFAGILESSAVWSPVREVHGGQGTLNVFLLFAEASGGSAAEEV